MIRNEFTNETAHVANWFLYSGHVDLEALFDGAGHEATNATKLRADLLTEHGKPWNSDEALEYYNAQFFESLEYALEQTFLEFIGIAGAEIDLAFYIGCDEFDYREAPPEWLILTLFGPMIRRSIDFDALARIVAEHVNQLAV